MYWGQTSIPQCDGLLVACAGAAPIRVPVSSTGSTIARDAQRTTVFSSRSADIGSPPALVSRDGFICKRMNDMQGSQCERWLSELWSEYGRMGGEPFATLAN